MMASLPQTPAQTGLASILAALGTAALANEGGAEGGFEKLLASLPATSALPAAAGTPVAAGSFAMLSTVQPITTAEALPTPDLTAQPAPAAPAPPAAALFGLPQPGIEVPVGAAMPETPETTPESTKAGAPVVPVAAARAVPAGDDAAVAASLLIAVATPLKVAATATEKPAPVVDAEGDGATDGEPTAVSAQPAAQPAAEFFPVPVAATIIAAAMPATDKPVAEKTAKPAAATAPRHAEATTAATPPLPAAKPEAAQPQQPAAAFTTIEPRAAKPVIDAGASMTVLFAQPDLQGAAPLAETAKAAPVAERILDTASDDQWIAQLAADIAATKSDKGELSFRLMPRHLGRLDVSLLAGDEGVTLRLDTQHETTATLVQSAQPRLVEDLRQQGVRVAEAQVTHTPAETGRQQMQQQQGQGRGPAPDASHLIETAAERHDSETDERTAGHRGRFA